MLAAEVKFLQPQYRSVQVILSAPNHYLLTFFDRGRPLTGLEKLPFRKTQWQAIKNAHRQLIYLEGNSKISLEISAGLVTLIFEGEKLPISMADKNIGQVNVADFEVGLTIADRIDLNP